MKNYMAILFALGFLSPAPAFARIGETPAQCEARYGKALPGSHGSESLCFTNGGFYKDGGYWIEVDFDQGKADSLKYSKLKMSESVIWYLLAANGGDKKWKEVGMHPIYWQTEDGELRAYPEGGTTLRVCTKQFDERLAAIETKEAERKAKEKKELPESLAEKTGEPITGAFGVTLGTRVDLSKYTKTNKLDSGEPMYGFIPKNPVNGLTEYYFLATPKTGIIYRVWAIGHCGSTPVCVNQQAVLVDILEKKYGPKDELSAMDKLSDEVWISRGHRGIVVKCRGIDGLQGITLELIYGDGDLQKQAENERIELEGKKVNGSGL